MQPLPAAESELRRITADWDRAMIGNDPEEIGRYMADDWVIIGPDGVVTSKAAFLSLVGSGEVMHDVMETHDLDLRVHGNTAVVIGRGISGGRFRGTPFHLVERVSSVFLRGDGGWTCVSTHLSNLAPEPGP